MEALTPTVEDQTRPGLNKNVKKYRNFHISEISHY